MELGKLKAHRKKVEVPGGEVSYLDVGDGPVALFLHGVFLNGFLWRNVIDGVRSERRCIAIDLPAHGETQVKGDDFSLDKHTDLVVEVCDALGIDRIDLVGNDTGGAIAQMFAVRHTDRLRTLTLTNCDAHDHFPPENFKPAIDLAKEGKLAPIVANMTKDLDLARSESGLGSGYEHPEKISDELIEIFLGRYADPEAGREIEKRISSIDPDSLVDIEPELRKLEVPTLIAWGTADTFFDTKLAYWLRDTIPGATEVVEIEGGKLFWVDERADELIPWLRKHWSR